MRTAKLTKDEIIAAEMASENRRQTRAGAYKTMREARDIGATTLSNGIKMLWHVDPEVGKVEGDYILFDEKHTITTYPPNVPPDFFALVVDGKKILFDTEEFRKWLRWA